MQLSLPWLSSDAGAAIGSGSWLQAAATLGSLALLEAVLSAENAVALGALVRELESPEQRRRALNWGLVIAFLLRFLVIVLATWVVRYGVVQIIGGLYLIWLAVRYFQDQLSGEDDEVVHTSRGGLGFGAVIALVGVTDLAFSLDSVSAAVAVTDRLPLVVAGGAMGVVMLRFLAGWVIGWMDRFVNLQNAAYLTVLAVGFRLLSKVVVPALSPSETGLMLMILGFFLWGFSRQRQGDTLDQTTPRSGIGV
jgi:YkoY family integral membrane protein